MHKFLKFLKASSFIAFLLISCQGFSQEVNHSYSPDPRLYECMNRNYLQQLSNSKSELILYYNYYLNHSYYVVELKSDKPVTGTDIHTVPFSQESGATGTFSEKSYNANTFNVFKYVFVRKLDGFTTYVWKEAGVALVFYPTRHVQANFNYYLKNNIEE